MLRYFWTCFLFCGFVTLQTIAAAEDATTAAHSVAIQSIAEAISEHNGAIKDSIVNTTDVQETPEANSEESLKKPFTFWEFEIEVHAFQHEPAAKSLDEFKSKLTFAAQHFHDENDVTRWAGFGDMTSTMLSRGSNSFQAPHRATPNFFVNSNSFWNREAQLLSVRVKPQDAVTYSLTTGQVLGKTSILQYILPNAVGQGFQGTLETFTIPANVEPGAEFHAKFDTSDKHVCWYEGKAILRVTKKYTSKMGLFKDLLKKHGIEEADVDNIEVLPDSLVEEDRLKNLQQKSPHQAK